MTDWLFTADTGLATGTDVTTANAGSPAPTTVTRSGTPTVKFDSDTPNGTGLSIRYNAPTTNDVARLEWSGLFSTPTFTFDFAFKYPSGGGSQIINMRTATGLVFGISFTTTGTITVINSANSVTGSASVGAYNDNAWHRIGGRVVQGSTTANGTIDLSIYSAYTDTVAAETLNGTGKNFGTTAAPMTVMRLGKLTSAGVADFKIDALQFSDTRTTLFNAPPATTVYTTSGTATIGITAIGSGIPVEATSGSATVAIAVSGSANSLTVGSASATVGISATGSSKSVLGTTGTAIVGVSAVSASQSVLRTTGASAVGLTTTASVQSTAITSTSGSATVALTASGTAIASSANIALGYAAVGLSATGTAQSNGYASTTGAGHANILAGSIASSVLRTTGTAEVRYTATTLSTAVAKATGSVAVGIGASGIASSATIASGNVNISIHSVAQALASSVRLNDQAVLGILYGTTRISKIYQGDVRVF